MRHNFVRSADETPEGGSIWCWQRSVTTSVVAIFSSQRDFHPILRTNQNVRRRHGWPRNRKGALEAISRLTGNRGNGIPGNCSLCPGDFQRRRNAIELRKTAVSWARWLLGQVKGGMRDVSTIFAPWEFAP